MYKKPIDRTPGQIESIFSREAVSRIVEENELLREEVRVARRASEITAKLVVEQFVKTEKILRLLEETAANEKELRKELSEKLREAEEREAELARERLRLQEMQIAAKGTWQAWVSISWKPQTAAKPSKPPKPTNPI